MNTMYTNYTNDQPQLLFQFWIYLSGFNNCEQVNIALWPRFKMVFDLQLNSLRNANIRTLWEDDVHPHYVMRRYAEFTASLIHLNVEYGDGQVGDKTLESWTFLNVSSLIGA